jgi:hypothetical protein
MTWPLTISSPSIFPSLKTRKDLSQSIEPVLRSLIHKEPHNFGGAGDVTLCGSEEKDLMTLC